MNFGVDVDDRVNGLHSTPAMIPSVHSEYRKGCEGGSAQKKEEADDAGERQDIQRKSRPNQIFWRGDQ